MIWYSLRHRINSPLLHIKCLVRLPVASKFWEPDKRGGYDTQIKQPFNVQLKDGIKLLGPELYKYKEEMKTKFRMDSFMDREPGDYEVKWKFDNKETINNWTLSCDSDHNEGYSSGEFLLGKNKTGIFKGYLDTRIPKDGITKKAGYVNIRSPKNFKSFKREIPYEWERYNNLMIRFRGDGRPYMLLVHMNRHFDVQWHDQYHYPLYTKGGPYWQTVFLPFNRFYMTGKGRVQNKQQNLIEELSRIGFVGITIADGHTGPFHLEVDFLGLFYDSSMNEEFAYEMYETEPYKVTD